MIWKHWAFSSMVINTRATIFNCRNLGNNPSKNPDYSTILLLAADTVQSGDQSGGNWMGSDRASNKREQPDS